MVGATTEQAYISVDSIPEIGEARQEVREQAWEMVHLRNQQVETGNEAALPLTVDALSTAEAVLDAENTHGRGSEVYEDRLDGLELDCLRLVAEWYRKKRPEYFPQSRHFFDAVTGDFYSHGLSIRQMTENALRPIDGDTEEVARRVNERVENETPLILKKLGSFALDNVGIRTISECTDKAINDYQGDLADGSSHKGYGGYVPEIEKIMIRDIRFDELTGDRLEEQIGLPGVYITHYVLQEALGRRGVDAKNMDKTKLHGTQLLVKDDLIDFVQLLDEIASDEWCAPIFMGEVVSEDHQKDYSTIREEAAKRQEGLTDMAETVATFIIDIARDGVDRRKAPALVEEFVKKLLLNESKSDTHLALQIFDEKTALGLQEVNRLELIGNTKEAFDKFLEVEAEAPGGGYCSGGSCGLESVDIMSKEGTDLAKKLNADSGDIIVKDKERSCKCGSKTIVYAYNKSKVNKYCGSCKAFETKITRGK